MKVYAVVGVPPEVQAYAMAKYSRSAQSMLDSIGELSIQRAEQFLNTFYFQYGHRSIADLAHLVMGVEDVSILAAIRVVDEQLWDGQERSTRYQPFKKTGYFTPPELQGAARDRYTAAADAMFAAYDDLTKRLLALLVERVPRPDELDPEGVRADAAGPRLRRLARAAAARHHHQPRPGRQRAGAGAPDQPPALRPVARGPADRRGAQGRLPPPGRAAAGRPRQGRRRSRHERHERLATPTTTPPRTTSAPRRPSSSTPRRARTRSRPDAPSKRSRRRSSPPSASRTARTPSSLAPRACPEDETVATLLYRHDRAGHSYRQVQAAVAAMPPERKQAVLDAAVAHRGPHDDLPRELQSGYAFAFDLLMDVGSFRDLHRHRRCVQIVQEPTPEHGAEPASVVFPRAFGSEIGRAALDAGLGDAYDAAAEAGVRAAREIAGDAPEAGAYLLPLAARVRALFKMDAAQAVYISELRTGEGGHFSYRQIAWEMYEALRERAPALAGLARPTPLTDPPDLLRR